MISDIGLIQSRHQLCLWYGVLIPGQPPIYVALWVDDFIYFSASVVVERHFELALSSKVKVDFMGDSEFFLGTQFDWTRDNKGNVTCSLSQPGYIHMMVEKMNLQDANTSPRSTPYRSGLTIDSLPPVALPTLEQVPIVPTSGC
ncbi:MAG: hypothetical protein ACRDL7_00865 [Gaiellaceae bacterium]